MNPIISSIDENENEMSFTLSNINVSIANSLRRTLLDNIDIVVFKTSPNSENDCNILNNTTRFNDEVIKQRLSCIPIGIKDFSNIDNFELHVNCENTSKDIQYVTTEHFNIYDKAINKYVSSEEREKIFPKNKITGNYIQLVRLRPRISEDIIGEELKLTCKMSISNAGNDYMFNSVCKSTYGFTCDKIKCDELWTTKEQNLRDEGLDDDKIEFLKKDWYLLDSQRHYVKDSFDFQIESVGVYTCKELLEKACDYLKNQFIDYKTDFDENFDSIVSESTVTIENAYDIKINNKDASFCKCLEYMLYYEYFEKSKLIYCGYQKKHPHDNHSIIRIAFPEQVNSNFVRDCVNRSCDLLTEKFDLIKKLFS